MSARVLRNDRWFAFDMIWNKAPNEHELAWIHTGNGGYVGPRVKRAAQMLADEREASGLKQWVTR